MKEYACNMKGLANYALDCWRKAKAAYPTNNDEDNMILTGRCQAYSAMLHLITGIPVTMDQPTRWQCFIDTMLNV